MKDVKEKVQLFLLAVVYLLCVSRYYPGRLRESLVATGSHLLTVAPFSLGATILIVSILQRLGDGRLPRDRVVRIFLALGITFEFFFGLYHYLATHQQVVTP
ncbi:MAG: hypothetical protein OEV91_09125 [Desulfobulbaceae bacterium]|nr:hypothetical protein [Desulfobulbaceae bacterium]